MLPRAGFVIQPILVTTYHDSYLGQNPMNRGVLERRERKGEWLVWSLYIGKALISLLTINPSWTSVKKTPGEANKTLSPQLSYFT